MKLITIFILCLTAVPGKLTISYTRRNVLTEGWGTLDGKPTVLFAHQGEKVLVPAHTLASYEIAAINGGDYIEPDLVLTKDGVLVCYHDVTLKSGTDIASHPEFDHLKTNFTGEIGGMNQTYVNDWFVRDFTLAELRTIFVEQRAEGIRPQYFNDQFTLPTFQEFLEVIHRMSYSLNRTIGIIPELKHPSFHNEHWSVRYMENEFLRVLSQNGYAVEDGETENCTSKVEREQYGIPCPPVIIQNFDRSALEYLSSRTRFDLMMVVHPDLHLLTYKSMEEISQFAAYFCVQKEYMYVGVEEQAAYEEREYDADLIESLGGFVPANQFVVEAHRLGMRMTLFTVNDSREPSYRGCAVVPGCEPEDKMEELFYFFQMGVDGMFIENIAETREIRILFNFELLLQSSAIR